MDIQHDVLIFWFGDPASSDYGDYKSFWFQSTPQMDEDIRKKFRNLYERAIQKELDFLMETSQGTLALVLILDQVPRNMFRGTAQAFASDEQALSVAKEGIAKGFDQKMDGIQRLFFYLPFQHSESLKDQEMSLKLYASLEQKDTMAYAQDHYNIIKRFGRFPHRNTALGRNSTQQEKEYLMHPDTQTFGQKQK